jgi:hypothetical protein
MKGDYARETRLGRMWILGAVLLVFGVVIFLISDSPAASSSVILILLGAVLLVPLLLRPVSMLLGRVTNRMARGVGDVAVLHLAKERSRSAYTLALVMVVMAMLFATGGLYLSVRAGIGEIIDRQFGADVFVQSRTPDDGSLGKKLAAQPGVDKVTPIRHRHRVQPRQTGRGLRPDDRARFLLRRLELLLEGRERRRRQSGARARRQRIALERGRQRLRHQGR